MLSGWPKIIPAFTTAEAEAFAVVNPAPVAPRDFSQLVRETFRQLANSATIIIDGNTSKLFATDNATTRSALLSAVSSPYRACDLVPDAGQDGVHLKWSEANLVNWTGGHEAATGIIVDAVKPQRSAQTVAQLLLKILLADEAIPTIVIDQTAGKITVNIHTDPSAISSALAAVTPGGKSFCIELTEPRQQWFA